MGRASGNNQTIGSRRRASTNAQSWASLGISQDWLESFEEHDPPQTATLGWFPTPDGEPVVGLSYRCDYRAEEEWGIGKLTTAITGEDPRNFWMTEDACHHVGFFSDVNGLILSVEPLQKSEFEWGEPIGLDRWEDPADEQTRKRHTRYASFFTDRIGWVQEIEPKIDRWMTVAELIKIGRETLGMTKLPRKKADLYLAVAEEARRQAKAAHPDTWPCWFEDGKTMIFRADGDGVSARVLAHLVDAAKSGTLGIGNGSSNPFSRGLLFFDARDETIGLREQIASQFAWHDEQMAKVQPLLDELALAGYVWYFVGNPRVLDTGDGSKQLRFWVNGIRPAGYYDRRRLPEGAAAVDREAEQLFADAGQVSGWFTLEQFTPDALSAVARERIAEKAARRHAA